MSPILGIWASGAQAAAAGGSFESIATISVSSNQASVTFSSIPGTYKHLQIRGISRQNRTAGANVILTGRIYLNSDTASDNNYTLHGLYGDGVSPSAYGGASVGPFLIYSAGNNGAIANNTGAVIIDILDYADTNKYKTMRSLSGLDNNGSGTIAFQSSLWRSTSAITSITLKAYNDVDTYFAQYSHFALYGIKSA